MAQKILIPNGVPVIELEEIVIGSQFKFAVRFERLVSEDPDVFEPLDFDDMEMECLVKDNVKKDLDVDADAAFVCTPRLDDGWVDFLLDGDATGLLLEKIYNASFKVWPTASPELGDTLLAFVLPLKYKASR